MHIHYLKLQNFRNYSHLELTFSPYVNVFWGNNGEGKTNLLEAIHMLSTGRSFRAHRLQDMIKEGESYFYIEAHILKDDILQCLKVYYDTTSRKVIFNETTYSHFTSLLGFLPSVLLSPDDLSIISGSPSERRRFLDLHIAQIDPLYLYYLSRYYKAMKQRNALLRSHDQETLNIWEQVMSPAASYLIIKRKQTTALLQQCCERWMKLFSQDQEHLSISYHSASHAVKEEELSSHWLKMRAKEMHYGTTLFGPHRDDMSIFLCGKEAKYFVSEGQKRSCIASLRFGQWEQMAQLLGSPPLLAIDDFGIQFDAERLNRLTQQLKYFGQVFLTTPHPIPSLTEKVPFQTFHIQQGVVLLEESV